MILLMILFLTVTWTNLTIWNYNYNLLGNETVPRLQYSGFRSKGIQNKRLENTHL